MGKKKSKGNKYVSKGLHSNVGTKFNLWTPAERAVFKIKALAKGKRVCFTIPNPDPTNTKARFIRVCQNG